MEETSLVQMGLQDHESLWWNHNQVQGLIGVQRYSQVQGLDYKETFATVSRMDSIKLVLVVAASKRWEVHHMDVKSAFLHGDLKEEIYMKQPEGYIEDPSLVFKLRKSFYALKQAPRSWYSNMDAFLMS